MLQLRGVEKSFGGVRVLRGLDFDVAPGEIVGLIGGNGAGKSTLMKIAAGIHLPDAGTVSIGGHTPRSPADAVEPKRILLAEDTRAVRRLLVSLLKRHGHTVKAAKDGLEAVQILAREEAAARPFDVVILDLEMPVMDGRQAAAEIRKRVASRPIRIVALTAHRTEGNPDLLGAGEFDAAVGKPVDAEQLLAIVASCRASLSPPRRDASPTLRQRARARWPRARARPIRIHSIRSRRRCQP